MSAGWSRIERNPEGCGSSLGISALVMAMLAIAGSINFEATVLIVVGCGVLIGVAALCLLAWDEFRHWRSE